MSATLVLLFTCTYLILPYNTGGNIVKQLEMASMLPTDNFHFTVDVRLLK